MSRLALEVVAGLCAALIVGPGAIAVFNYLQAAHLLPNLIWSSSILGHHNLVASGSELRSTPEGYLIKPLRGRWPGISLDPIWPDWRHYSMLVIDLQSWDDQEVTLFFRADDLRPDAQAAERYEREFSLLPRERRVIRIALADIESDTRGSRLDLAHMGRIFLFEDGNLRTFPFHLNAIRLE